MATGASFDQKEVIKKHVNKEIAPTNLMHTVSTRSDRDHGLISFYTEGLGIPRGKAGTVILLNSNHKAIGEATSQVLPLDIGYTGGTFFDLLDIQEARYKDSVLKIFDINRDKGIDLSPYNISSADIINGSLAKHLLFPLIVRIWLT